MHTVRTVYALCVLLFTTNPQCCVPVHLPLTDLILCHGGTTELVTVLNRFGAVASADTHSRFLQNLSADRKVLLDRNLSPNAFRIVSVDNIDLMQSHAQVYATDSHRSYHGTSIQCVEPMPRTCVLNAHPCVTDIQKQVHALTPSRSTDIQKRVHALTPSRSPSVLMDTAKRMRVLPTAGLECVSVSTSLSVSSFSATESRVMSMSTSVPPLAAAESRVMSMSTSVPPLAAAESRVMSMSTSVPPLAAAESRVMSMSTSVPPLTAAESRVMSMSTSVPLLAAAESRVISTLGHSTSVPPLAAAESRVISTLGHSTSVPPLAAAESRVMSMSTSVPPLTAAESRVMSMSTSVPPLAAAESRVISTLGHSTSVPPLAAAESRVMSMSSQSTRMTLAFSDFQKSAVERQAVTQLEQKLFQYIATKHSLKEKKATLLFHFHQFLCTTSKHYQSTEKSNVTYLDILNEHADSKETIHMVLELLEDKYKVLRGTSQYLIVVGDAKTFNHLVGLKREHPNKFTWLLPFPGDWHILKNFHPVIVNIYADAGLRQLAETSGFRSTTLTSLLSCSNFRLVHNFIVQMGEAVFRTMFAKFMNHREEHSCTSSYETHSITSDDIVNIIAQPLLNASNSASDVIKTALLKVVDIMETGSLKSFQDEFNGFVDKLAGIDSTWKFWKGFISTDFVAYMSLFTGLRTRDWNLRVASLKQMAPLFCAFDRPIYSKILPDHIMDMLCLPEIIITQFQAGAFAVALGDRRSHSVGLDEAHEMGINKGIKQLVVRPTNDNMQRLATVMHYRAKVQNSITSVAGTAYKECQHSHHLPDEVISKVPYTSKKIETNIAEMMSTLKQSNTFEVVVSDRGLVNFLNGVKATPEQQRDLLTYHDVGEEDFKHYVNYYLLHTHSTKAPHRKKRLNTFSTSKKRKTREKQVQKERKLLEKCLRRRIQWIGSQGKVVASLSEQLTSTPRALADEEGLPLKGAKSKTVDFLGRRYCDVPLVTSKLPSKWQPHAVILEGMFLIYTSPLSHHFTIKDYAFHLLQRYALKHFQGGAIEVHIVFDDVSTLQVSPKVFERQRRGEGIGSTEHEHHSFAPELPRSIDWKDVLKCRTCKRNLTESLANAMLQLAPSIMSGNSRFITAGAFHGNLQDKAVMVHANNHVEIVEALESCMEEGDTRVWLHCKTSAGTNKIIYSPDTDTFHVAIGLLDDPRLSEYDIYVQLNKLGSNPKYMHLTSLQAALLSDPDLAAIPTAIKLQCLQTLYVVTGCDYTSFMHGFGKVSFLKNFFQHAAFITGPEFPGSLGDIGPSMQHLGFLSFTRLVGTMYFKAHLDAFVHQTPQSLYNSIQDPSLDREKQHETWLDTIRSTCWVYAGSPADEVPSVDALYLHWRRSVWVINMWHQALRKTPELLPITDYGWEHSDKGLKIVWDSTNNISQIQQRLDFYTKGCKCSKGDTLCNPQKGRCGCTRNGRQCGPACKCSKEKCCNISKPSTEASLEPVPPHCTHTSDLTDTVEETHTLEEMHTPEEMYSESEDEDNEDSDDEVQSQCLAIEIENPEIDDIMREVFGDENMLL